MAGLPEDRGNQAARSVSIEVGKKNEEDSETRWNTWRLGRQEDEEYETGCRPQRGDNLRDSTTLIQILDSLRLAWTPCVACHCVGVHTTAKCHERWLLHCRGSKYHRNEIPKSSKPSFLPLVLPLLGVNTLWKCYSNGFTKMPSNLWIIPTVKPWSEDVIGVITYMIGQLPCLYHVISLLSTK